MPAIQPAKLKIQISQLMEEINNPDRFVKILNDILFFYADRTRKPGRGRQSITLTQSYQVPKPVFRELERSIRPVISSKTDLALILSDLLWEDGWLETRVLALMILASISPDAGDSVFPRVQVWAIGCKDDRPLLDALAVVMDIHWDMKPTGGSDLLESWIKSPDLSLKKLGLRLIPSLMKIPEFSHLPYIFPLLTPLVRQSAAVPNPDLLAAIKDLAGRTPWETAFFLQRNLTIIENTGVFTLIRQSLDDFPEQVRADLLEIIHLKRNEVD